jgi:hypothetical protein
MEMPVRLSKIDKPSLYAEKGGRYWKRNYGGKQHHQSH